MNQNRMSTWRKAALVAGLAVLATSWTGFLPEARSAATKDRPIVEECKRCHDVATYEKELASSPHAFDKDKKPITCDQCHQFHFNPLTSYYARDEYYDKKIFKPEDFNRRRLQKNARTAIPPEKCRACHKDLSKNAKGEPISEIGQLCHDAFLGKNGTTRRNCAGCHINVAHLPPFDRGLQINAEFVKKLAESEKKASVKGGEKK